MIHRYQKKGLNFVLDVNSGAVHLLDDISYAVSGLLDENMGDTCPQSIIDALPDYTADEIREAYDELYELKKAGQLFAQDDYIDVSRYIPVNAPVKALCLHVAHDCNLRCKYCFASTGDFGQGRKIMPPEIAKKAIDFVIARSGVRHNIEVDFFGQVCAESVGTKHMSGSGGQIDFVRGACQSKGGKSFIAFTSTAKGGTISKIKPILTPGAVCTTSKNDVDYIVTEYGIAHMRGRSLGERTRQLIAIAHPDFRDELSFEAKKRGIII